MAVALKLEFVYGEILYTHMLKECCVTRPIIRCDSSTFLLHTEKLLVLYSYGVLFVKAAVNRR